MGLLDQFSMSDEQNQGLLAAASQILQQSGDPRRPFGLGQALGAGISTYQGSMIDAKRRKLEEEQAAQAAQMRSQQMQMGQFDLAQRQRGDAEEQAMQGAYREGGNDPQALIDAVSRINPMKGMELRSKMAKQAPKFDTKPQVGMGPDGKPFTYLVAEDGTQRRLDDTLPREPLKFLNLHGKTVGVNEFTGVAGPSFQHTQTQGELANNNLGWAKMKQDATQHRETLGQGKIPPGYRMMQDGSMAAIPGGPADPNTSKEGVQRVKDANDVLGILDQAEPLLKQATNSYAGVGLDMIGRSVGFSTEGSKATAKLKVLQGALISKMPKMSGPQSDKDVQLYREMAGQIGDPTIPADQRQSAVEAVRALNQKYAGQTGAPAASPGAVRKYNPKTGKIE